MKSQFSKIHLANKSVKRGDNKGGAKDKEEIAAREILGLVTPELFRQRLAWLKYYLQGLLCVN